MSEKLGPIGRVGRVLDNLHTDMEAFMSGFLDLRSAYSFEGFWRLAGTQGTVELFPNGSRLRFTENRPGGLNGTLISQKERDEFATQWSMRTHGVLLLFDQVHEKTEPVQVPNFSAITYSKNNPDWRHEKTEVVPVTDDYFPGDTTRFEWKREKWFREAVKLAELQHEQFPKMRFLVWGVDGLQSYEHYKTYIDKDPEITNGFKRRLFSSDSAHRSQELRIHGYRVVVGERMLMDGGDWWGKRW